jgi:hypothetical protein
MKSKAKRWRMYMWFFKLIPLCCRLLDHVAMISQVSAPQQSLQKREWTNHTTEESKLSRNSSKYVKLLNKFKCTSTGTKAATRLFCSSLHTMGGPSFFGHGAWGGRVGYCYTNYVVTFAEQSNDGDDLHKNNPKVKAKHRLTLRRNYFTHLTLLCGAPLMGATHASAAPLRPAPHTQPMWHPRR